MSYCDRKTIPQSHPSPLAGAIFLSLFPHRLLNLERELDEDIHAELGVARSARAPTLSVLIPIYQKKMLF